MKNRSLANEQTTTNPTSPEEEEYVRTLNLRALAMVGDEEKVLVGQIPDRTIGAFDETLVIMGGPSQRAVERPSADLALSTEPKDSELRKVFKFADILGGYDAFNDLTRRTSPSQRLSSRYRELVLRRELTPDELKTLEEFHDELNAAVASAKARYRETQLDGLTVDEMRELHALVSKARDMAKEITEILGRHLILQIERAVARLSDIRLKSLSVERTINGVFLVDDEVMYIPETELTEAINAIFKGVGNPYLANNVDGVLLLAARNLLIEVVSFYSYYGKHQIYQLFKHGHTVDRRRVMARIRNEIRKILWACKVDNKLVLTRIMRKHEEELDLSIEAIQREAEKEAVEAVIRILPVPPPPVTVVRKSWFRRFFGWLGA